MKEIPTVFHPALFGVAVFNCVTISLFVLHFRVSHNTHEVLTLLIHRNTKSHTGKGKEGKLVCVETVFSASHRNYI